MFDSVVQMQKIDSSAVPNFLSVGVRVLPKNYTPPDWAVRLVDVLLAQQTKSPEELHVRSVLLSGPPRCGKDTVSGWMAEQLQLPILVFKSSVALSSRSEIGNQIAAAFQFAVDNRCVLVLEDLDEIAPQESGGNPLKHARNSRGKDGLVAAVQDWNHSEHRSLLIATTTAPDSIDEAVRRRFRLQIDMESNRSAARRDS